MIEDELFSCLFVMCGIHRMIIHSLFEKLVLPRWENLHVTDSVVVLFMHANKWLFHCYFGFLTTLVAFACAVGVMTRSLIHTCSGRLAQ